MRKSPSRAPQGARGLKLFVNRKFYFLLSRAPQGARGLKYKIFMAPVTDGASRPARGAWVEIIDEIGVLHSNRSRPARGAWVEIRDFERRK